MARRVDDQQRRGVEVVEKTGVGVAEPLEIVGLDELLVGNTAHRHALQQAPAPGPASRPRDRASADRARACRRLGCTARARADRDSAPRTADPSAAGSRRCARARTCRSGESARSAARAGTGRTAASAAPTAADCGRTARGTDSPRPARGSARSRSSSPGVSRGSSCRRRSGPRRRCSVGRRAERLPPSSLAARFAAARPAASEAAFGCFSRVAKLNDNVVHLVVATGATPPAAAAAARAAARGSAACSALPAANSEYRSTSRPFPGPLRRSCRAARGSRKPRGTACAATAARRARRAAAEPPLHVQQLFHRRAEAARKRGLLRRDDALARFEHRLAVVPTLAFETARERLNREPQKQRVQEHRRDGLVVADALDRCSRDRAG